MKALEIEPQTKTYRWPLCAEKQGKRFSPQSQQKEPDLLTDCKH